VYGVSNALPSSLASGIAALDHVHVICSARSNKFRLIAMLINQQLRGSPDV